METTIKNSNSPILSSIASFSVPREAFLLFLFILVALLWGGAFVATKKVALLLTPVEGTTARLIIALVVAHLFYAYKRYPMNLPVKVLPAAWLSGILLQAIPYLLFFWGMRYVTPGLGGLIEGSMPLFVCVIAWMFQSGSDSITRQAVVGVAIGMLGIVLIFADKMELQADKAAVFGMLLIIGEMVSIAFSTVITRKLLASKNCVNGHALFYQQTLASCLVVLPALFFMNSSDEVGVMSKILTWPALSSLLYLGVFATAICNFGYNLLIKEWGSVRTGAVGFLIPVAAFAFDYLFFGNTPKAIELVGGLVIFAGIALLGKKQRQKPSSRPKAVKVGIPSLYKSLSTAA